MLRVVFLQGPVEQVLTSEAVGQTFFNGLTSPHSGPWSSPVGLLKACEFES